MEALENPLRPSDAKYAIIPDSKGDGTDALVISGKMAAVTDVENGTFDVETKTFTSASV